MNLATTLSAVAALIAIVTAVLVGGRYIWGLADDVKRFDQDLTEVKQTLSRISDYSTDEALLKVRLSRDERTVFDILAAESHGAGDGVSVYALANEVRGSRLEDQTSTAVATLQEHGFVVLDEDVGYDDIRERESSYPVYRITARGFRWRRLND